MLFFTKVTYDFKESGDEIFCKRSHVRVPTKMGSLFGIKKINKECVYRSFSGSAWMENKTGRMAGTFVEEKISQEYRVTVYDPSDSPF